MRLWLDIVLCVLSAPVLLASLYLLAATLLSGKLRAPAATSGPRRFRFVVPAHDEAAGIAATVKSLLRVDYPADAFDVLVIADNCSDDTAERARAAGATVLERHDQEQRGKGHALLHAFQRVPAGVDAVVVIDADTLVSPNLLWALAARRDAGAEAVQADYAVRNPMVSWRTRLMAIAFGSFHIVRSRARERLQLSCGLRGNGMCFSLALLEKVPHEAFSIVEDVEYGIRLGEAGYRVHYADEAHVYGEMVSTAAAAGSQRRRWEQGRKALTRQHGLRLVRAGLAERKPVLIDLGLDLLVPPLSRLSLEAGLGLVLAVTLGLALEQPLLASAGFGISVLALGAYVFRGWMVSGTGLRGLLDLALAPLYVIWKASLRLRRKQGSSSEWIRTRREHQSGAPLP